MASFSVQLYSVRDALAADLPGTLARLATIGYTQVEPYDFVARADEFAAGFAEHGLTAPTAHAPLLSTDQDAVFAAAEKLGIGTVIDPYIPAEQWQDAQTVRGTAERLNAAAEKAAEHGLRVGYHNHAWELESTIEGTTALEYFASLLDPEVVLEVDAYWAVVGGQDPAALVRRLGQRVIAVHLKDGPVSADTSSQLPAGQGAMDLWAVLDAAQALEVGVVEFDSYAGDIFEGVEASLRYLEAGPAAAEGSTGAGAR